jgi:cell shape-determining protein MreC
VTSVTEKDLTHKHILVQPAADILRLEEVFIIKPLSNSPPDMKTGENYRSDQREITFE